MSSVIIPIIVIYGYYFKIAIICFTLQLLQKYSCKSASSSKRFMEDSDKSSRMKVSDKFRIKTLNWVKISVTLMENW